jgi:hypothetical protein
VKADGVVFARDPAIDRLVAIKLLRHGLDASLFAALRAGGARRRRHPSAS